MYGNDNPNATTIAGVRSLAMPPRLHVKKIHIPCRTPNPPIKIMAP
jgi:hypothetical protein